ncbi:hypothetical protein X769_15585 [Mesorhizobium sp. LSJC268A00]|uniref:hypothetical protein n=1 Tax=unclassified Mesorhizobium TaxID=325217 RepID=UPI0003CEE7F5|nr:MULTISPECIES: hypothetical protein [unclassified Mesorhizobium]ESX03905.1 hypothetical protein X769_15585 [Mesorhizobium sp. LSJC268A00]ESZ06309.1 hypothetical protein X735_31310 [Mesorhizobium sp. L2C085B000]
MNFERVTITGKVTSERTDIGSKSERDAVVLETDEGQKFVLQRQTGPSYGDHALDKLVGEKITTNGFADGDTLIMEDWEVSR